MTKQQMKLINEANKKLDQEVELQMDILYHSAALCMKRKYKWGRSRIENILTNAIQSFDECLNNNDLSMIRLCDEELNIELMRDGDGKHWYDYSYFVARPKPISTWQELISIKTDQRKWVPAQITASVLVALHRTEDFSSDKCGNFFGCLEDMKYEYGMDSAALKKASRELTGFVLLTEDELEELKNGGSKQHN